MKKQTALKIILAAAVAGVLFSGYLSYTELFAKICAVGGCSKVGSVPACVYGFFMYAFVVVITVLGLKAKK